MANLGQLERAVMQALWEADGPLSAYDLLPRLASSASGKPLAATTVLTVLTRLEKKGFARADRASRPHRFTAADTRADYVAELLHDALHESADRRAVLERFVGGVSAEDAELLRGLLAERDGGS